MSLSNNTGILIDACDELSRIAHRLDFAGAVFNDESQVPRCEAVAFTLEALARDVRALADQIDAAVKGSAVA